MSPEDVIVVDVLEEEGALGEAQPHVRLPLLHQKKQLSFQKTYKKDAQLLTRS